MLRKIFFLILLTFNVLVFSQTLGSNLDKDRMNLGDVATLRIKVFNLNGKDVESAPLKKLLPFHFEILKDSISKSEKEYERTVQFQIFEEGNFKIPPLDFKINGITQKTIPYDLQVVNPAKNGDQLNDIMKNKEINLTLHDYWNMYKFYVLAALILIALIFLIVQFIKYFKRSKNSPKATTNKTLKELDALKKKKYIESGNYRLFYVELIEITRNFLTEQYHIPANVLLTDDLIDYLKNHNTISPENEKTLEDILQRSDLVKFAKTFPDEQIMRKDWQDVRDFVKRSVKDLELENLIRKDV